MADRFEILTKTPPWQLAVGWAAVAGLLGAAWYFIYYADAVAQRQQAETSLANSTAELAEVQKKFENFEQEMAKAEDMERQIEEKKRQLPLSAATIDHLMRKFQQQGRLVGVDVANWRPGSKQVPCPSNSAPKARAWSRSRERPVAYSITSTEAVYRGLTSVGQAIPPSATKSTPKRPWSPNAPASTEPVRSSCDPIEPGGVIGPSLPT